MALAFGSSRRHSAHRSSSQNANSGANMAANRSTDSKVKNARRRQSVFQPGLGPASSSYMASRPPPSALPSSRRDSTKSLVFNFGPGFGPTPHQHWRHSAFSCDHIPEQEDETEDSHNNNNTLHMRANEHLASSSVPTRRETLVAFSSNLENTTTMTTTRTSMTTTESIGRKPCCCCCGLQCDCFLAYLVCGLVGFVLFWTLLMLRLYLPERYWDIDFWTTKHNGPQNPS